MSKEHIKEKFKPLLETDLNQAGPEGWMLAGLATLLDDKLVGSWAEDVQKFHHHFGIEYIGPCRTLAGQKELRKFRIARSQSEHDEYVEANTLEGQLDAIIDHIYILLGTAHLHGFSPAILQAAWTRVHEANMKKIRATRENPGKFGHKHDIVKPEGWQAPDHSDLLV